MEQTTSENNKSMAFKLFKGMQDDNLEYTYRGSFTSTITDTILTLAESNLDYAETGNKIKKKVYFIMVEGLQNITRHQNIHESSEVEDYPGLFVIQRKATGYFITTGNIIKDCDIEMLKQQIDKINTLDRKELKEYSLQILSEGGLSDKGGAGLGLIEMARRSGNKLYYDFKSVSKEFSFFYLHTKIPYTNIDAIDNFDTGNSLENIKHLHEILENENILLNFSGNFTQDTIINLLSIIEKQLKGTIILKMKVFNLMVEMLQNVVKHADNYKYKDIEGKHAIFFISENENQITFTSGNYIKNERIKKFKNSLEKINTLEKDKLNDFYNQTLFSFEDNSDSHTGLGLIDIKMKCKNAFEYDFYKIDDNFSFFSLKIYITKMKTSIVPLILKAGDDSPEIILDAEKNIFSFSGRSIPENAVTFFKPVLEWMTDYSTKPNKTTDIVFNFEYFNTASAKQIAKLMVLFEKLSAKHKVLIKWKYQKEDIEMKNDGLRYQQLTDIDFMFIENEE